LLYCDLVDIPAIGARQFEFGSNPDLTVGACHLGASVERECGRTSRWSAG
jgi:hypothetical protein